jgi:hypothetical protein
MKKMLSDGIDQCKYNGITWDEPVPRKMKYFEGALIRRADVGFDV